MDSNEEKVTRKQIMDKLSPMEDIMGEHDFLVVSESLLCDVTHTDVVPGFKTDYSMINLSLSLHSKGPVIIYWGVGGGGRSVILGGGSLFFELKLGEGHVLSIWI